MKVFIHFLSVALLVAFGSLVYGQNPWTFTGAKTATPTKSQPGVPQRYKLVSVSSSQLLDILATAPHETDTDVSASKTLLDAPLPGGSFETFRIVRYDMLEKGLADAYPAIATYYGQGVEHPAHRIRLNYTSSGFNASISSGAGRSYVVPTAAKRAGVYQVYYLSDLDGGDETAGCAVDDDLLGAVQSSKLRATTKAAGDCVFRSYRLAVATTGEYSNALGATSSADAQLVLDEMVTAVSRINDLWENDLSIRFILVDDITDLFYYDRDTDPFTNAEKLTSINEVQPVIDANIGNASYDIGHLFMLRGGGLASSNGTCGGNKGRAVSGIGNSLLRTDVFYIDLVSHEFGHQFGCRHTFNNSCGGAVSPGNSYETGAGSTIMSYAGICGPGLQPTKDFQFHSHSIKQVGDFVTTGGGGSCAVTINSVNQAPSINPVGNFTIPASTPFVLAALGTDPDAGDQLTYSWEQFDSEMAPMPPLPTNEFGPLFRVFAPTVSPERYFPRLSALVNNVTPEWEVLPSVSRALNFRCVVRDNSGPNGCTDETDMLVNVSAVAGPFLVTEPNAAATYEVGSCFQVRWDVANTDGAPVNASFVDILLSTDGGLTYPTVLASNVDNNGFTAVDLPNIPTTTGRIMVKASGNVFFDISNEDFTIEAGGAGYDLCGAEELVSVCPPNEATYSFTVTSISGYSTPVSLAVSSLPDGASASLSSSTANPGDQVTVTVSNTGFLAEGVYSITVSGSSAAGSKELSFDLQIGRGAVPPPNSPADGATAVSFNPTLSWGADALTNSYEVDLATDAAFTNIISTATIATTSYSVPEKLTRNSTYYWRVRGENDCGSSAFSATNSFSTHGCFTYSAEDLPLNIPAGVTGTYTSTLNIADEGIIEDFNVLDVRGIHENIKNLTFTIKHDGLANVNLITRPDCRQDDFNISFDSESPNPYATLPCPPVDGQTYQPAASLEAYNGASMTGDWQFSVTDAGRNFGGELQNWTIDICPAAFRPATALPVELVNFTATAAAKSIQLDWQSAGEISNAGFEVQRRSEGQTNFAAIAWVEGKGTSDTEQDYTLSDATAIPGTVYYYRLKQVDFDATATFSRLVSAVIGRPAFAAAVFPNPTTGMVWVEASNYDSEARLELTTLQGRALRSVPLTGARQPLDLTPYPPGVYLVRVVAEGGQVVRRVVKR